MGDLWVVTCSGNNNETYDFYVSFSNEFNGLVDDPNIAIDEIKKLIDWYNADPEQKVDNYKEEEINDGIIISFEVCKTWGEVWDYVYLIEKVALNEHFSEKLIKEATKE